MGSGESSSAPLAFAGNLAGSSDDIRRPSSEIIGPTISGKTCPMGLDERLAKWKLEEQKGGNKSSYHPYQFGKIIK